MLLFTGVELAIGFHCLYELVTDCDSLWARGLCTVLCRVPSAQLTSPAIVREIYSLYEGLFVNLHLTPSLSSVLMGFCEVQIKMKLPSRNVMRIGDDYQLGVGYDSCPFLFSYGLKENQRLCQFLTNQLT